MLKLSMAKGIRKKFDKKGKIWYYINRSSNIHNLFKKFWQHDLKCTHFVKELGIYYAKCTICLPKVSALLLGF